MHSIRHRLRIGEPVVGTWLNSASPVVAEHRDAVERIDEILSIEGIDAAFLGPYDLSASMGLTARFDHPDYLAAHRGILDACERHNVAPGIHVVQPAPDEVLQRIDEGYRFIAYSLDITMLTDACRGGLRKIWNADSGTRE